MTSQAAFLIVPILTYAIGAASPGPANFAIMATAMEHGRRAGLVFGMGVLLGSVIWGVLALLGLGALMLTYSQALTVLKIAGGLYLLWLAVQSARAALVPDASVRLGPSAPKHGHFLRGTMMHLMNPKPILTWTAVVALGLRADGSMADGAFVLAACAAVGSAIFCGYALVFSSRLAIRAFARARRAISGALAVIYGAAGSRMIASAV